MWIRQHQERDIEINLDEGCLGYEPFWSDSGVAICLRLSENDSLFRWELDYEKNGTLRTVTGSGVDEAVDFGIRRGNYVGSFVCHRAPLARFWPGMSVWMRSDDLLIRPADVIAAYRRRVRPDQTTEFTVQ